MTNEELKKKIVEILNKSFTEREVIPVHTAPDGKKTALPDELCEIFNNIVIQAVIPYFADALIAAGMVDKSDYSSMKETAVRYKAEVSKAEARAKEAEHRAEVAESELERYTVFIKLSEDENARLKHLTARAKRALKDL